MDATFTMSIPTDAIVMTAPLPELLSQHNVEATTGIPAPRFLELLRASGFPIAVTKLGKLRLVDRAAFVTWIRCGAALAVVTPAAPDARYRVDAMTQKLGLSRLRAG